MFGPQRWPGVMLHLPRLSSKWLVRQCCTLAFSSRTFSTVSFPLKAKIWNPTLNATVSITQKPLNQSYQSFYWSYFYWSYVHNMHVAALSPAPGSPSQYFAKAEGWASQKKSSKHNQRLSLTGTVKEYGVKVEHAHCTCHAGIARGCQHVVACLFTMEKCKQTNYNIFTTVSPTTLRRPSILLLWSTFVRQRETQLPGVTALDYGQQSEPAATEGYMSDIQQLGHSGLDVFRVGLCLHTDHECICS